MRICAVCGKQVNEGFTDESGSFYVHENCFTEYMDKTYGKGGWMALGHGTIDEYGGYYIATADTSCGYEGTGIYWTQWDD